MGADTATGPLRRGHGHGQWRRSSAMRPEAGHGHAVRPRGRGHHDHGRLAYAIVVMAIAAPLVTVMMTAKGGCGDAPRWVIPIPLLPRLPQPLERPGGRRSLAPRAGCQGSSKQSGITAIPSARRYASGPVVITAASSRSSPSCPRSQVRWRTSSSLTDGDSLTSSATIR